MYYILWSNHKMEIWKDWEPSGLKQANGAWEPSVKVPAIHVFMFNSLTSNIVSWLLCKNT